MTLKEARATREKGGFVELSVTHNQNDLYPTHFVVVSFEKDMIKTYQLIRYFQINRGIAGEKWLASVDLGYEKSLDGLMGLEKCLVELSSQFKELYPESEEVPA